MKRSPPQLLNRDVAAEIEPPCFAAKGHRAGEHAEKSRLGPDVRAQKWSPPLEDRIQFVFGTGVADEQCLTRLPVHGFASCFAAESGEGPDVRIR
jgi:hypothetical protein